jgi:hypothetical protein
MKYLLGSLRFAGLPWTGRVSKVSSISGLLSNTLEGLCSFTGEVVEEPILEVFPGEASPRRRRQTSLTP